MKHFKKIHYVIMDLHVESFYVETSEVEYTKMLKEMIMDDLHDYMYM